MVTLLIHSIAPEEAKSFTRFRGRALIPPESELSWPICAQCHQPMSFLGQIRIDDEKDDEECLPMLLALFLCENDDPETGPCESWEPDSGANFAALIEINGLTLREQPPRTPRRIYIGGVEIHPAEGLREQESPPPMYGAAREETDLSDYDEARERWCNRTGVGLRQVLGQLGGEPCWLQGDETPNCHTCGKQMRFLLQLEEGPDWKTAFNFGGGGWAYAFACDCPGRPAKMLWQC